MDKQTAPLTVEDRKRIAQAIGVVEPYIYQIAAGKRQAPITLCPRIERESGGRLTVEGLRPDVAWVRVKDRAWPVKAGRPLHDSANCQTVYCGANAK